MGQIVIVPALPRGFTRRDHFAMLTLFHMTIAEHNVCSAPVTRAKHVLVWHLGMDRTYSSVPNLFVVSDRNHFRWRVMPPDGASEHGLFDRSFQNKKQAVAYQKQVKVRFPDEPCCLIDTGRWHDSFGRIIR